MSVSVSICVPRIFMFFQAGVGISVLLGSVQSRSDHWIKLILGFVGGGRGSGTVKRSVLVRLMFRWYLCSLSCDVDNSQ